MPSFSETLVEPMPNSEIGVSLGTGVGGGAISCDVRTVAVYDNKLIAGGEFMIAGGIAANHVAAWDGYSWSRLDSLK